LCDGLDRNFPGVPDGQISLAISELHAARAERHAGRMMSSRSRMSLCSSGLTGSTVKRGFMAHQHYRE
jgi:hypothetical protein